MKLKKLLEIHLSEKALNSINNNWGDAYLLNHNFIYKSIRQNVVDLNYQFTNQVPEKYLTFSMGQIELILKNKILFYLNNVEPLIELANTLKNDDLEWDSLSYNLKPNYVFHESCHAVARSQKLNSESRSKEVEILNILIEESFANTCEYLAISEATDLVHRLFLEMNSYFTDFENRTILKKMIESFGLESVFKVIIYSYIHSLFLNDSFTQKSFSQILELSSLKTLSDFKTLKSLAEKVFDLNPYFRKNTTEMYFKLAGYNQPIEVILNFDGLDIIEKNVELKNKINSLAQMIISNDT